MGYSYRVNLEIKKPEKYSKEYVGLAGKKVLDLKNYISGFGHFKFSSGFLGSKPPIHDSVDSQIILSKGKFPSLYKSAEIIANYVKNQKVPDAAEPGYKEIKERDKE